MRANVKGTVMDAPLTKENGQQVGWASVEAILAAYGIPTRRGASGTLLLGLRAFAAALGQPTQYVGPPDDIFYLAAKPLPPLPAEPVGANVYVAHPVTAPICGGPGDRRPNLLERIIQQFRVAINPRYAIRDTSGDGSPDTFCNIFVWDVTRALGAEIPYWVVGNGEPSKPGYGRELDANSMNAWLRSRSGPDHGWRQCDAAKAGISANTGKPVVATWLNPGGIGHIAMVRPGVAHPTRGVPIAQAGGRNFDDGHLVDGFGARAVEFYAHD